MISLLMSEESGGLRAGPTIKVVLKNYTSREWAEPLRTPSKKGRPMIKSPGIHLGKEKGERGKGKGERGKGNPP